MDWISPRLMTRVESGDDGGTRTKGCQVHPEDMSERKSQRPPLGAPFSLHHFQPGIYLPAVSTSRSKDITSRSHRQEAGPTAHLKAPVGGPPTQWLTQVDVLSPVRLEARAGGRPHTQPGAPIWAGLHGLRSPGKPLSQPPPAKLPPLSTHRFLRLDTHTDHTCASPFL